MNELRQEFNEPLAIILEVVNMSSSSYHYSQSHSYKSYPEELVSEIKSIRTEYKDYGYRSVTMELHNRGIKANHKLVLKIMNKHGLLCHAFDRKTRKYNSYKGNVGKRAKNKLNRRFITDRPFQKITTDVTELRWGNGTTSERAYFTAFMDMYSDEVISWNISLHPNVEFVTDTLDALIERLPELPYRMTVHSDQGFQYQNYEYVSRLKKNRIIQSMSRKATCLDNAIMESFFHILKVGTVHNNEYSSYEHLKEEISKYIYYYNNKRIKAKLAGKTPVEYRNLSDRLIA
ncbi:IS3 family transposase [Companilactobacillus pabuli]|uniref:IS3 family transposase n=1 Tax=Companilactobacillus pabuli TaxID=2714036 RepID=UPI00351152E9